MLLTDYDADTDRFSVNDPGYSRTSYARSNVSDMLMYELLPSPNVSTVPLAYPLFKQCDPRWGPDLIHVKTVCSVGCLMSSTSMVLRERGVGIPAGTRAVSGGVVSGAAVSGTVVSGAAAALQSATPGTLNTWLLANGGYVGDTDDLDEAAVVNLDPARIAWNDTTSMHRSNDIPWEGVVRLIDAGAAVIANVMDGHHFVLVVGYDPDSADTLFVNDPGFDRPSYSYANDVVGWRLYAIDAAGAQRATWSPSFEAQRGAIAAAMAEASS